MGPRLIGLLLVAVGAALFVYEYWFSYCSTRFPDFCFFPVSPDTSPGAIPLYPLIFLLLGLALFHGGDTDKGESG